MKYVFLILVFILYAFLVLSGCHKRPGIDSGLWHWEEVVLAEEAEKLKKKNAEQKQEILYLQRQLKEFWKWSDIQDDICGE